MRTTVVLDDDLLTEAQDLTGIQERRALLREALSALIARESARRLSKLAGTDVEASAGTRRRSA